jgi:hypothetical protein
MSDYPDDLPVEIVQGLLTFMREVDGELEITDPRGMTDYIFDNSVQFPSLRKLLQVDRESIGKHLEQTGEVPPGVRAIRKRPISGTNITRVDIVHGPGVLPKGDE